MKKITINKIPNNLEQIVLPAMNLNPKLVLGGSIVLYMLGMLKREPKDIDFSLSEKLTEYELYSIKDFFNVEITGEIEDYKRDDEGCVIKPIFTPANEILSRNLIQFRKPHPERKIDIVYKIDIFNNRCIEPNNILCLPYGEGTCLEVVHPSYIISAKAKYAFDHRVKASYKHMEDLKQIMEESNLKQYFNDIKAYYNAQINEENLFFV
jgi:hypothetical protein